MSVAHEVDSLSSAVSFARALLALSRSEQSGVLSVESELGRCRFSIVKGVVRAASSLPGFADALGDGLLRQGELDPRAHGEALGDRSTGTPVGRWLVDSGLASGAAVERALRRQVRERVLCVLACQRIDYRFEPGITNHASWIEEPTATADLVLSALRARVWAWSVADQTNTIPKGELRLNPVGHAILRDAVLWPQEAVAAWLLARGTDLEQVMQASRGSARARGLLCILTLLSALSVTARDSRRFSLLVRKREQLRKKASVRALLDLPTHAAPADARRALRRLARDLHPDALGPHAGPALRAVSSEVMRALIDAQRELCMEH